MEEDLVDPFHDNILKDNLFNYFKCESLCDVILVTEKKEISAHRIILASVSMYFRTHFTTNVGSSTNRNVIKFLEYNSDSVEAVINFIYSGKIFLSMSNVFDLMDVEELLQVKNLRSLLSSYLSSALDKNNCWEVLSKADYYGYYSLYDTTFLYILQNFKNVIRESEFLLVPYTVLTKCLDSPVLNVPTEGALLCNLVTWVVHDYESRKHHLEELLNRLKPSQILSLDHAVTMVTKLCADQPTALAVLDPWLEKAQLTRNTYTPLQRRHKEIVLDALFAVGGKNPCGSCVGPMEVNTNLPVNPWKLLLPSSNGKQQHEDDLELPPLPTPRHSHSHASSLFSFFIVGGENEDGPLTSVEKYDVIYNSWTDCPSLPFPLTCSAAAYLDSCLYVAGGLMSSSDKQPIKHLLALRGGCKKWVEMSPMNEARCDHGLVAVAGALYAIAGEGEGGKLLSTVERYDPSTNSWVFAKSLFHPRKVFCSTVIDNSIFVVGGQLPTDCNEYNERYDVRNNSWRKWKMYKSSRCVFGGSLGRKVVVVSQTSGHAVQTYSTVSETTYDGGPALNHVRIRGSLIPIKLPLYRLLPI